MGHVTPVFNYISKCCNERATKPPCEKTKEAHSSLGKWTCSKCGNTCSVSRQKRANGQ